MIQQLIDKGNKGVDLEVKDERGKKPLELAIEFNMYKPEVVELLLDHGVKLEEDVKRKVLHWAFQCGHVKVIQQLIDQGVDLEEKDERGKTLFQLVAIDYYNYKPEVVELLLSQGVKIEEDIKRKVLHWACKWRHIKVVRQLINKGVNLEEKDEGGKTPLELAIEDNLEKPEVVGLLLEHGVKVEENVQQKVLHWACRNGHAAVVQQLINEDVNLEKKDEWGNTPLEISIESAKFEIAELLLSRGVKIEEDDKRQVLYWACRRGHVKVVQRLINEGVNLEEMDEWGRTPLEISIESANPLVVELLLDRGVKLEENFKLKIYHWACKYKHANVIQQLINKCVNCEENLKEQDVGGKTPLELAIELYLDEPEVMELLLDQEEIKEDDKRQVLYWACRKGQVKVVQQLLEYSIFEENLKEMDEWGKTPLEVAIENDNPLVVELLLDQGVKLEEDIKQKVFHWVCKWGHFNVLESLIDRGLKEDVFSINEVKKNIKAGHRMKFIAFLYSPRRKLKLGYIKSIYLFGFFHVELNDLFLYY